MIVGMIAGRIMRYGIGFVLLLVALQAVTLLWRASPWARAGSASASGSGIERRDRMEALQQEIGRRQMARYRVTMAERIIADVPVRVFVPAAPKRDDAVLLNLHGGGFAVDAGSITENVPIAALTGRTVIAVRYRLLPEHRFPAAIDDALRVYRALLADRPTRPIALYGTSAGATLAAQLVARLRREKLPLPVALGFFAGTADLSRFGSDADRLHGGAATLAALARRYAGDTALDDPALSPARASLAGWPPTLCVSSTQDFLLSATRHFCRQLGQAGVAARLIVQDGQPHAFWSYREGRETDAIFAAMAAFLRGHLDP